MKKDYGTYILVGLVALVLGFGVGAWWRSWRDTRGGDEGQMMAATSSASTTILSSIPDSYSIQVSDQAAGSEVNVASASFEATGWVVITEDDDGSPARILGAQEFLPSMASGTVDLLKPTIAGQTYHAIIYNDNGDNIFDYKVDSAVMDQNGNLIQSIFKAL